MLLAQPDDGNAVAVLALRFALQQGALAIDAPSIAGQLAIAANYAVAEHENRERVRTASLGNRARAFRHAESPGDLGVCSRRADRNLLQRLPDFFLEVGSTRI